MRRVLVVGGAGYIGSHCVRALQDRGDHVVVLDDLSTGHEQAVDCELVRGDVRDPAALDRVLGGQAFDAAIHLAAKALVGESVQKPELYFDVNVGGTSALAHALVRHRVPALVFSSTCAIYGTPESTPVDELHPKRPESPYGMSKWLAEQVLAQVSASGRLSTASLRYFNACGAHPDGSLGESHEPETHLIPLALQARLGQRGALQVYGRDWPTPDGTCVRDYIHVMDLAEAHLAALDHLLGGGTSGAWNLGTGQGSSVLEVLQAIERQTGEPVPFHDAPRRPGDPAAVWARPDKAMTELGWSARRTTLDEVIRDAWRWARNPRF